MTLDIRGGLKNTAKNQNHYVALEELLSNAIDSYLIRRSMEEDVPPFLVEIEVAISTIDMFDNQFNIDISFCDNGAGFGNEQVKAFITKDSTYKDNLQIQGIGKCKGSGRIQYFHHFKELLIESTFRLDKQIFCRTLSTTPSTHEITEESFLQSLSDKNYLKTKMVLRGKELSAPQQELFFCQIISQHLYRSFLQRFIILKGLIGDFSIKIAHKFRENTEIQEIQGCDLPHPVEKKHLSLLCSHGRDIHLDFELTATRYSFSQQDFPSFQHEIALCANSAVVLPITNYYLKNTPDRKKPIEGNFELILIEGKVLEQQVNLQRDGFDIPKECDLTEELDHMPSLRDIIESLEDYVFNVITPRDFDKEKIIRATQEKFGITPLMLNQANVQVRYSDTEENIAKRVLKKYQEEIITDTSSFIDLKQELLKLDPRSAQFREKVDTLSWQYTSTIKKIDMANLSQLVVRRSAMIEVLRHAVAKLLNCQQEAGKRHENERIIHNIFFPMGKDSHDTKDHDIWLLNEEYQYFEHIASDKSLSSLRWFEGGTIFESDIDESLQRLFAENNKNHSAKRPDIAIFSQEGAVIIIEFKAPGVPIQEHINDLVQYARLLAAKSGGKIRKFYGYLIGTVIDHSRMPQGWKRFANSQGYFLTGSIEDPETGRVYGELYTELLFYDQFINRAERRLNVFKNKLNVQI